MLVALALAKHADKQGKAFPGRARLAAMTGLSEVTIKRALRTLVKLGVVSIVAGGRGRGRLTVFQLADIASEKGPAVIPFKGAKGGADDPFCDGEKGSFDVHKRGHQRSTVTIRGTKDARARESAPDELLMQRAGYLAKAAAKNDPKAFMLSEWRRPEVAQLAIAKHGADPAALRALGCQVPSSLPGAQS